jgi:hypothetical protein
LSIIVNGILTRKKNDIETSDKLPQVVRLSSLALNWLYFPASHKGPLLYKMRNRRITPLSVRLSSHSQQTSSRVHALPIRCW